MNVEKLYMKGIPAILWGEDGQRLILAAHGSHSSKIDDCLWVLAEEAVKQGYRVLSFDFPQHGERVYESDLLMPDECVRELRMLYDVACEKGFSKKISLFGCSMGAYFQLLAFGGGDAAIDKAWFLSPVTDMEHIIHQLMTYCHITEEEFEQRVLVENDRETLYYPYYQYVRRHPITVWPHKTYLLRGEKDTLCEASRVADFARRFSCELTEQKGGEHWFHTEAQLTFFRQWLRERL